MKQKIKIRDPMGYTRTVGTLNRKPRSRTFDKQVTRSKHYMRKIKGYGIQKEVFDEYLRGRKGIVRIHEKDTGKWLIASIKTWADYSKAANFGDGKQIFLSERFMHGADDFDRSVIENKKETEQRALFK